MTWSAPRSASRAAFAALLVETATRAPKASANRRANIATPPVPWTRTLSARPTRHRTATACQAVSAAIVRDAACAASRVEGTASTWSWCDTRKSASTPGAIGPPMGERYDSALEAPVRQWGRKHRRDPVSTSNRATPGPIAATVPAASEIGVTGCGGRHPSSPRMTSRSR